MMGKVSFRQIGIIMGLAVMLPMVIYSAGSDAILEIFPNPIFSFTAVNGEVAITWDVVFAILPIPVGLLLGVPRPKLIPMDKLIIVLCGFMMHKTSVVQTTKSTKTKKTKSSLAGFAEQDDITPSSKARNVYQIAVSELGIPKNITITLYDLKGRPMRGRLARIYIDDVLLSSITADSDGVIGMTFVPRKEGMRRLRIMIDGMEEPAVDAALDVKRML